MSFTWTGTMDAAVSKARADAEAKFNALVEAMKTLSDYDREEVFYELGRRYCKNCGRTLDIPERAPFCNCDNDE